VSVSSFHACALTPVPGVEFGGRAVCWGNKKFNRLNAPEEVFIQISSGEFATCGVTRQERVRCWGDFVVEPSDSLRFLQVSCGQFHCCGVLQSGGLTCWGQGFERQVEAPTFGRYVQVSCGQSHSCAIAADGTLSCWGSPLSGGTLPPAGQYVQLSCFDSECCAIRLDGILVCWGGSLHEADIPFMEFGEGEKYLQVAVGKEFVCGIKETTLLRCWGSPGIVSGVPTTMEAVMVSAGKRDVCAVGALDSKLVCWGGDLKPPTGFRIAF